MGVATADAAPAARSELQLLPAPMLLLAGHVPGTIDVFFRELVHRNKKDDKSLGYLLFLQGTAAAAC